MMVLLSVFAIWKLTIMLMDYDGPFDIIKNPRQLVEGWQTKRKLLNFECFFCFSTVVTIPFAFFVADGWDVLVYWLGLSGMAWFVNVANERLA